MNGSQKNVEVVIVGASLAAAAAAKRLVDAGIDTLVIERKTLPRHKICSGILSPRGHRFLLENFGPLPPEVLHQPTSCRGVTFHFPTAPSLTMDFYGGPTPHLHRKFSDHWAIRQSGVPVMERTIFEGLETNGKGVTVRARRDGEMLRLRARHVIGADGPNSAVVRAVYPDYHKSIPWFMVGQKFHDVIDCPLDDEYFHFWFNADLGYYTWSHARDGRQIVGAGFECGGNFNAAHRTVVDYLHRRHDVRLGDADGAEACPENFGLSLVNRYVFGRGDVLITGQAAGFLNMMAEGMSCALHSGAISGEAVVEARSNRRPVQEVYRKMIASEVRRCSDQWNPFQIAFGRPHEADFRKALGQLSWSGRLRLVSEMVRFIKLYGKFRWGRQMLTQAVSRAIGGGYDARRWL